MAIGGALALVVGGLVAAHLFDLDSPEVALLGSVPGGLPAPQVFGTLLALGAIALIAAQ